MSTSMASADHVYTPLASDIEQQQIREDELLARRVAATEAQAQPVRYNESYYHPPPQPSPYYNPWYGSRPRPIIIVREDPDAVWIWIWSCLFLWFFFIIIVSLTVVYS